MNELVTNVLKKLTVDNWISLLGIALPIIFAAVSFIIKMVRDNSTRNEEIRPNVFISYERGWKDGFYLEQLVLKNYGKTAATVTEIQITPEIQNNGKQKIYNNPFGNVADMPLAPGQEMRTTVGASGKNNSNNNTVKREKRHFLIKYKNVLFKHEFKTEYDIDETKFPELLEMGTGISKVEVTLNDTQFATFKQITDNNKNR